MAALEGPEKDAVVKNGVVLTLPLRYPIYAPGEQITSVVFPIDCVISVVTRMLDGKQIEMGTVGREGVSAIPLLLGATTSVNEAYCQVPGRGIKVDAAFFASLKANAGFVRLLDRYLQGYVNMLGQIAACNRLHTVYERCARWLLMTQDRIQDDKIHLTHEFLGMMLGTERSGVTIAAGTLQKAGLISYGQGIITVVDRPGLELAACECYGVAREQFGG